MFERGCAVLGPDMYISLNHSPDFVASVVKGIFG